MKKKTKRLIYGLILSPECWTRWQSVRANVLGQLGLTERTVKTMTAFVDLTNRVYEFNLTLTGSFSEWVYAAHDRFAALSKQAKRDLRQRNGGGLSREKSPRSLKKQAAIADYRAKHLVLATSNGDLVFNNVKQGASKEARELFYKSWEWRTLRMEVIKKQGKRCNCCGATPEDLTVGGSRVRLVVDHIKPLSKYWQLRLAPSNLQILCDECNMGKGAWDETDHRSESQRLIEQQLSYEVI